VDLPLDVEVYCADGLCGRSTTVIINPISKEVTHLAVRKSHGAHIEVLVPIDLIIEASPSQIRLSCTGKDLMGLESFIRYEFIESPNPLLGYAPGEMMVWPYVLPEESVAVIEHENLEPGEVAIRRGDLVRATNGRIGRVDEFLVDPVSGHITHLVLREGHLWGQRDVTIPVSQIDRVAYGTIYLKLTRQDIENLPTIPVRERRRGGHFPRST
jgi:hypothetical protein